MAGLVEMTEREKEIALLMEKLYRTDYVIIKLAEADTPEEQQALRARYAETIQQRRAWRERIRELENTE